MDNQKYCFIKLHLLNGTDYVCGSFSYNITKKFLEFKKEMGGSKVVECYFENIDGVEDVRPIHINALLENIGMSDKIDPYSISVVTIFINYKLQKN